MLLPVLLLLSAVAVPGVAAADDATCYNIAGQPVPGWKPCSSSASADAPSFCCGNVDYCLDNGLCLDAGGDNTYTQQGCTDPAWGAPCAWFCPSVASNYSHVWLCSNHNNAWCCGDDATCCSGTDDAAFTNLGQFRTAIPLGDKAAAMTLAVLSAAGTMAMATTTATATITTTTTRVIDAVTETATATGTTNSNSTKLGVGIGVPVGVVCSALALAAGFYWGRRAGIAAAAAGKQGHRDAAYESATYERPAPKSTPTAGELPGYSPASAHGVFPPAQELAS